MINGTYSVFIDGKKVAEQPNIITSFGKSILLKYLAGNVTNYAGSLAVGISSVNPQPQDYYLDYELFRVPIVYKTINPSTSSVIFKGTAGGGLAGKIYEIGLFPSLDNAQSGVYQTSTIFEFDNDESWNDIYSRDLTMQRVGTSAAQIYAANGTSSKIFINDILLDLSGYSSSDVFKLAFITNDNNCASISVKFVNNLGAEMVGTFTPEAHTAVGGQHQIVALSKSLFSNQNADWSNIVRAEVIINASGGDSLVGIDGLKIIDSDYINPEFGLVSRTVFNTPITKEVNQTVEIEYSLVVPL